MNEGKIVPINIEDEIKESYLNYAMSVITSRALPDARDGLKPVHRRILYTMFESGMRHDTATKKSANVVGTALGRYHPHGNASVYDALVRMAQPFSLRYPLVFGQGNFGSLDRDPPAAERYTETRLEHIADEMLRDIKKKTVDFIPNYDESREEPSVLPAALPCLLLNGSTGIAVGFTTEIPPHNLREVAAAITAYIDNADISIEELMKYVHGPDFPTGAIIRGVSGIRKAYRTGAGKITIESHYTIEQTNSNDRIIFTDIPFAKNKAELIKRLADKVNNGDISSIRDIADESNKEGVRIVIDLKKDANTEITLQKILSHTDFRCTYSINMTALVHGKPKQLTLKDTIKVYVEHRRDVVTRKAQFELKEAQDRAHIVRGLLIAIAEIDEVIHLIKSSSNTKEAHAKLKNRFSLDDVQTQAILDMRLHNLTGLELHKLEEELAELTKRIADLESFLASNEKILENIKNTIVQLSEKFGDKRRTEIIQAEADIINEEDLIDKEEMMVTLSSAGYIKRTRLSEFGVQRRGGKGKFGITLSKDDTPKQMFVGQTHDRVLFITSNGRSFIIKLYEIPSGSRTARGSSVKGVLPLEAQEYISSIIRISSEFTDENLSLFLATKKGKVKKVAWHSIATSAMTKRGIRSISLQENDEVIAGSIINATHDLFLFSSEGKVLRFPSASVRTMGRTAVGCGGMKLPNKDSTIVNALAADSDETFILITSRGYGKRLHANHIMKHGRNTMGMRAIAVGEQAGNLVNALAIEESDTISTLTSQGKILRFSASTCPAMGRAARGVRVVTVDENDNVIGISRIENPSTEEEVKETENSTT